MSTRGIAGTQPRNAGQREDTDGRRRLGRGLAIALVALAVLPAAASAQATRTWVSGTGDDVNPCSRTAPCKTFAGAISKTAADGILNAMDPGGFGAVTITKGITIDGTGTQASILASGTNAVNVNAPGKDVVLRNLQISGSGVTECSGLRGINLIDARSLRVEGVTVDNFSQGGIAVAPATGNTSVVLQDVDVNQGCGGASVGVSLAPGGTFAVSAMLDGVTLTNLATGLSVGDRAIAYLANSTIFGNGVGLATIGNGIIDDRGGNQLVGNGTDGTPTRTTRAAGTPGPAGADGATGVTGATGATGAVGPRGATGRTAKIGKVSCKLRGRRKIVCKVATAKASSMTARISQAGRTVAAGKGVGSLSLRTRRAVRHGAYRMTLRVGGQVVRLALRL